MKLLDVFAIINEAQFLIERDVANAKELKAWAKESAARLTDPQAATWYASQLFKFLINRYDGARPMTLGDFDSDPPEWIIAKARAGEPVLYVDPQQELRQQAEQVIDWLNAMTAENTAPNLRMTWEEAVEAQHEWHRDIARQSRVTELTADQMLGVVSIMEFDDGFRWVDVQTEVCLQHEGTVMGHCVGQGGYTQGVSDSTTKILSLRDANNNPHATIEGVSENPIYINKEMLNSPQADLFVDNALEKSFVDMSISQIKGKENRAVVRKYRDYVQEFLTKFGITEYGYGGLDDLENCGLFKLKKGGYIAVEDIGEKVARMDDGSVWQRVDNEYVDLERNMDAKWYLYDKTGRSVGRMQETHRGAIDGIVEWGSEPIKYKDHINTAFNSKYDKGRSSIKPASHLYGGGIYDILGKFGLGVNGSQQVGEPQTVGKLAVQTEAGDVYATAKQGANDQYWLMHGNNVQCRFTLEPSGSQYGVHFISGIPSGSMTNFLTKLEENIWDQPIGIDHIMMNDKSLRVQAIEWEPKQGDELVMEQDGVKFYQNVRGWYNAIDAHGHHIFNMHTGSAPDDMSKSAQIDRANFKPRMVSDPKVAGFYAVYLIDELDLDIGEFTDYSSFARELLDETSWFEGERSNTWYVEDENFPIHLTQTETFEDGSEEDFYDEDTTMKEYWTETGLYDSGMENDSFAKEYENVYRGGNTGDYNEHSPYDDEGHGDNPLVRTDYYVQGIGNADTVTHPVSGGTVRVTK